MRYSLNSSLVEPTTIYEPSWLKRLQHIAEIIFIALFVLPLKLLGHKVNVRIYRRIFSWFAKIPACKQRALANLEYAYPDMPSDERENIAAKSWANLGNVAADFAFTREIFKKDDVFTIEGLEILEELKRNNQNAIFFSGHIATWEMFRIAAHHQGVDVAMIYRAFNNPYFDAVARFFMDYGFAPVFQRAVEA